MRDLAAYFISVSGFTETALEQERDFAKAPRLVLLDGKRIEIGWLWAVLFRRNAQATHVALVHADGELLALDLAKRDTATSS